MQVESQALIDFVAEEMFDSTFGLASTSTGLRVCGSSVVSIRPPDGGLRARIGLRSAGGPAGRVRSAPRVPD